MPRITLWNSTRIVVFAALFTFNALSQTNLVLRSPKIEYRFNGLHLSATPELQRPKIGLVLSGGGARGLAQIGVLRAFERHHIPVDLIVGNSLGSVVGGLYASGYSTEQLESLALRTNWDEVLSYFEESNRREKFVGEKQTDQTGFLVVRFDGVQPIIPSSVSSGQSLTNFFLNNTLQAPYQPGPGFDNLKIPFRAIATDLLSGKRVILDRGSLAEAFRASVSVPLLYASLKNDSMALVDGGLLSNIPVDVAKSLGCNVVIAVNSSGVLRHQNQMSNPWEIADQIMSIMMQTANEQQLKSADAVITPELGDRIASDFSRVDSLIQLGELATEFQVEHIQQLIREQKKMSKDVGEKVFDNATMEFRGDSIPEDIKLHILKEQRQQKLSTHLIWHQLEQLMESGSYQDVYAEVLEQTNPSKIIYYTIANPFIKEINFSGNTLIDDALIAEEVNKLKETILNYKNVQHRLEAVINLYRSKRYSLARIDSVSVNPVSGIINFTINEGIVDGLYFEGNRRTHDYVIRREFTLDRGNVFNFDEAYRGLMNVVNSGLFESVVLDVRYRPENDKPILFLKVREKSAELLRLGLHADNERNLVSTIDVRDENFRGAGENLGLTFRFDYRDRVLQAEYRANRIFQTYFTFNLKSYYSSQDFFSYINGQTDTSHWDITEAGRYREIKYGGSFTFGTQLQRLGDVTATIRLENHRIDSLSGIAYNEKDYRLVGLRFQSTIDTENKFWFPTNGILVTLSFETALKGFGSEVSFDKVGVLYESYTTFLRRHTLRPRITFGFADETLPTMEQYRLGGQESFFGLREANSLGRQMFVLNMEYRYWLPFKLVFETYFKVRYDLGAISDNPRGLTVSSFHHGIGAELSLDTPLGPAAIAAGKSFYYRQDVFNSPLNVGPLLFYFSFGHRL